MRGMCVCDFQKPTIEYEPVEQLCPSTYHYALSYIHTSLENRHSSVATVRMVPRDSLSGRENQMRALFSHVRNKTRRK